MLKSGKLKILVCRPDRLGDVILSTPVLQAIHHHYPDCELTFMVKANVVPILKGLPSVHGFLVYEPEGRHAGIKGFFRLVSEIRQLKVRYAAVLQTQWRIGLALLFAGVPERIGPLSKIHSFFLYNRGVRQRRSHVEMHEADYNLQLLNTLGIRVGGFNVPTRIHLNDAVLEKARQWLKENSWDEGRTLIQIHPGMGGSALNWPESHYLDLMRILAQEGNQLLVTGGPAEKTLLDKYESGLADVTGKVLFYRAESTDTVDFLGALTHHCQVVIAPSTGPLHLAVALGKSVVTFYPPIRVQSALRWGPYLLDDTHASVMVPDVYCGQDRKCIGSLCNYYPCMKGLTVKQVLKEVHLQLKNSSQGKLRD